MKLTSPSEVKAWCIENGFHPNKVLGQNFLIDLNSLLAIVEAGLKGAAPGCRVLEIGPGLGALTEQLLARGARVTAIEKDPVLAARLADALGNPANLEVIAGDALERRHLDFPAGTFDRLVANLPYQAGTRILLEHVQRRNFEKITVLVQTEVAERLVAGPGSRTRSLAGVWAQLDYDVRILRRVSANCFWPRPEIGSSVIELERHDRNLDLGDEERALFHRLTKKAFEHRRKQLGSIFKDLIQSTERAEALTNDNWINLTKDLLAHEDT